MPADRRRPRAPTSRWARCATPSARSGAPGGKRPSSRARSPVRRARRRDRPASAARCRGARARVASPPPRAKRRPPPRPAGARAGRPPVHRASLRRERGRRRARSSTRLGVRPGVGGVGDRAGCRFDSQAEGRLGVVADGARSDGEAGRVEGHAVGVFAHRKHVAELTCELCECCCARSEAATGPVRHRSPRRGGAPRATERGRRSGQDGSA